MAKGRSGPRNAGLQRLEEIKRLVIIAMFSDDDLMDRFVLKGGNALDLAYKVSTRASMDVDLSMESDSQRGNCQPFEQRWRSF